MLRGNRFFFHLYEPTKEAQRKECHPIEASFFWTSMSRSWLRVIFACQKSVRDFGITKYLQPSCPCQKHPFTKMQVRYFLNTMSGFPGSRGWLSLYLNPRLHRYLRTIISGFVFFARIAAMLLWRCTMDNGSDVKTLVLVLVN